MEGCTVTHSTGRCGKPAVWSNDMFAECEEHAAQPGSLASYHGPRSRIGEKVEVHRHGKTYIGEIVHVTRNNRIKARVTYDNGVTREVFV